MVGLASQLLISHEESVGVPAPPTASFQFSSSSTTAAADSPWRLCSLISLLQVTHIESELPAAMISMLQVTHIESDNLNSNPQEMLPTAPITVFFI